MRWHLGLSCIIHTGCTVQCCVSASMYFVLSISTLVRCVLDNEMGSCQLVGSFISAIVCLCKLCLCDGVLCWFVLACAKEVYWFFFSISNTLLSFYGKPTLIHMLKHVKKMSCPSTVFLLSVLGICIQCYRYSFNYFFFLYCSLELALYIKHSKTTST